MNKLNIRINSRVYTVVADEDVEYLRSLCDYVNEKVETVLREGNHVMGEKPVVLAALNICDEYFKLMSQNAPSEKLSELLAKNKEPGDELHELKKSEAASAEKAASLAEELDITSKVLSETEEKVKFLEGQITIKENQIKKQRSDFALREKELLDMLESK